MATDTLHRFSTPGSPLYEWVIPPRGYSAFKILRGQCLRLVDISGKQVPDIVCFHHGDHGDSLNLANTLLLNERRQLVRGDRLYSIDGNEMMTITDYSNDVSFAYGSMCSEALNRLRYGIAATSNCRDNLAAALAKWGIEGRAIPNAFVPFMNVGVDDETGKMAINEPTSQPGDYYDLMADIDLLVAVSNCPQERNPCNGFKPTETGILIYQPSSRPFSPMR